MSRVIFQAGNQGEAISTVKILTGLSVVTIPHPPLPQDLGTVLKAKSKYVSVNSSASLGFGFGSAGGDLTSKVLLVDYWFEKEVLANEEKINSWTFAAGYRVGIKIVGFDVSADVSLSTLAAKVQSGGLNVQIAVIRAGMPNGPSIPSGLANASSFDVEKFGDLRQWEGEVIKYAENNRAELVPMLVSASINIDGEKLLNDAPEVRYSLWRIYKDKMTLKDALVKGKAKSMGDGLIRAVYAEIFKDPTMTIPGRPSENRKPNKFEINAAEEWLLGYKNI